MKYNTLMVLNVDYPDLVWAINPDTADEIDEQGTMLHLNGVQYPDDYEKVETDETNNITKRLGKSGLPPKADIDAKIKNYNEVVEPARLLREERNRIIAATDWWASSDLIWTNAQKKYRQDLRDLLSTASPKLDDEGNLTNVTWPTAPS